jgi:hypothetical protein
MGWSTCSSTASITCPARGLAKRYADRHPDLTDLCLVRMSELHPRDSVITVDREDFRV